MLDQLSVLTFVARQLDAAGIAYMVTGSIAAGHYSRPRMTRDIDIVVAVTPQDTDRLMVALGEDFVANPDGVRAAIARRGMFNAIHQEAIVKVDFIVQKGDAHGHEEFRRRRRAVVAGTELWIVAPEDLVLSKLLWAKQSDSRLQLGDVSSILRVQGDMLDWSYLDQWAHRLEIAERLRSLDER